VPSLWMQTLLNLWQFLHTSFVPSHFTWRFRQVRQPCVDLPRNLRLGVFGVDILVLERRGLLLVLLFFVGGGGLWKERNCVCIFTRRRRLGSMVGVGLSLSCRKIVSGTSRVRDRRGSVDFYMDVVSWREVSVSSWSTCITVCCRILPATIFRLALPLHEHSYIATTDQGCGILRGPLRTLTLNCAVFTFVDRALDGSSLYTSTEIKD
jgi:hypothetical protein